MAVARLEQRSDVPPSTLVGEDGGEGQGAGGILLLWMALTVVVLAALWTTGFARSSLVAAVEAGAARVEWRAVGEVGDDIIRKAIRTQHATLRFWTTLTFLGQFVGEPLVLAVRAVTVATCFSALAALRGRPIDFARTLRDCALGQGIWVLGLSARAGLMMALRRNDVATSAVLALPAGTYPAWMWLALDQLDVFVVAGWMWLALGAMRRKQMGLLGAGLVCLGLGVIEAGARVGLGMVVGSTMRLSLLPA